METFEGSRLGAYFVTVFLMVVGLFIVIARNNLIKKLVGLGIFQTSVYLLYIAPGKLACGARGGDGHVSCSERCCSISHDSSPFCAWSRFSASCHTREAGPSMTSASTS